MQVQVGLLLPTSHTYIFHLKENGVPEKWSFPFFGNYSATEPADGTAQNGTSADGKGIVLCLFIYF